MEVVFNFIWVLVSIASVCLWLRFGRHEGDGRHLSFVALIMLVAVLFPVISVSDDLWSLQNPAETDTLLRRDHRDPAVHAQLLLVSALPCIAALALMFEFQRFDAPRFADFPAIEKPALDPIDNRPPPVA